MEVVLVQRLDSKLTSPQLKVVTEFLQSFLFIGVQDSTDFNSDFKALQKTVITVLYSRKSRSFVKKAS